MLSLAVFALALCASVQGRAVNISNTWVLPEEGFPVFYRYFRDRISWYEADAVCQFHHANLVTVDTTAQYDAVRAYLKELDISSAVWVGLIRSNPDGDFTWTDYRGLDGDGYWSSAPDPRAAPLCAAADPAADYRWEARACGGPTVASFICELPVPQWALGNEGCMVKALPALTALYLPESAAVQLTADCGLAGVKRVQCTGNVKREDLLRDLSCAEDVDTSSTVSVGPTGVASTVTSEAIFTDQDTISEVTTEENGTTEHEDDINQSSTVRISTSTGKINQVYSNKQNQIYISKNVNLDNNINNNLQSNDIPRLGDDNNYVSNELSEKLEDERNKQHKMLHDEFARHGNFENIFTQPTDHFVPPLVMAKSRLSDDMTVLSLEEKHAQQLAEQRYSKLIHGQDHNLGTVSSTKEPKAIDESKKTDVIDKLTTTKHPALEDEIKKDILKSIVPKKYNDKFYGLKNKIVKVGDVKPTKLDKTTDTYSTSTTEKAFTTTGVKYVSDAYSDKSDEEPTIDLTVIIKEPDMQNNQNAKASDEVPKIEIIRNDSSISEPEIKLADPIRSSGQITQEISVKLPTNAHNFTTTHQVIKITILKDDDLSTKPTEFEFTTKVPIFDVESATHSPSYQESTKGDTATSQFISTETLSTSHSSETTTERITTTPSTTSATSTTNAPTENNATATTDHHLTTEPTPVTTMTPTEKLTNDSDKYDSNESNSSMTSVQVTTEKEFDEMMTESEDGLANNTTDSSETIDDFQSPLLSAANEPLHRPNRSRRPQPPPNRNKFNPFRILG